MGFPGDSTWVVTSTGTTDGLNPISPEAMRQADEARAVVNEALREVVGDLTWELGHEPVFHLHLVQIAAEGQVWRRVDADTVEVSGELMRSPNLIAPLESVIREIAR
jgi:hypothetical protein